MRTTVRLSTANMIGHQSAVYRTASVARTAPKITQTRSDSTVLKASMNAVGSADRLCVVALSAR
jgi:hypothetical protein